MARISATSVFAARVVVLVLLVTAAGHCLAAGEDAALISQLSTQRETSEAKRPEVPALGAAEVDAFVAPLSDVEARRLLIAQLRERAEAVSSAEATAEMGATGAFIQGLQERSVELSTRAAEMVEAVREFPRAFEYIIRNLTDQGGAPTIGRGLLVLLIMVAVGWLAEWLVSSSVAELRRSFEADDDSTMTRRLARSCMRAVLHMLGVLVFAVVAYAVSFAFFQRFDPMRVFVVTYLAVIVTVRTVRVLSRIVLAPRAPGLRLVGLGDADAGDLHRWLLWLAAVASFGFFTNGLLAVLGLEPSLRGLFAILVGLVVAAIVVGMLWRKRTQIGAAMLQSREKSETSSALAQSWHLLAAAYVAVLWGVWALHVLLQRADAGIIALGLIVLAALPLVDWGLRILIGYALSPHEHDNEARRRQRQSYARLAQTCWRVLLVAVAVLVFGEVLGMGVSSALKTPLGRSIGQGALNIAVAMLIAYVVWDVVKAAIDRHLPDEQAVDLEVLDGEGGSLAPTTRAQTLLPLLRSFVLVVLLVMVTLIVLSSLGVNVGPLLAGAGVVGIAIGFGSQKLVHDIVSGIFFLIDDAFRVGEYIEAGGMRGTIESISLRSMRLRHHRGAVQTLPYGEITAVRNLSRDWVILKLELRVPYDTDIEMVRKIIKKVGQDMQADEVMGKSFLQPLKSQGVLRVEDSALIIRMKFMSVPNEQWILRREAYRRVRDALQEAGISFAHRQVTVHVPESQSKSGAVAEKAAAAAVAQLEADIPPARSGDLR